MAEEKVRKIRRIAPCPSYNVERLESWLQDMAKEGWHLNKIDENWFGFFPFKQGAPQNVRYRLEPRSKRHSNFTNAPDEEEEGLYKQYGWEFVMVYNQFYIYRTADLDARELNTDLAVQSTALKALKRDTFSILLMQVWLVGYWGYRGFREFSRILVTFDWFIVLAFVILMIGSLVVDTKRFLYIRKLQRQLKNNIPLDHNKPWRKTSKNHCIKTIAIIVIEVLLFIAFCRTCSIAFNQSYSDTPTSEFPGDPPFVTMEDIFPDSTYTPEKFMNYNDYNHYSTSLAPTIIEWKEFGEIRTEDGSVIDGSLSIDYYETVSPTLARGLVDDFLYQYERYDDFRIVDTPDIDVDYVVAIHYIYPTVLIQHDNIFICATVGLDYQEEYLLEEWAYRMAEYLQN